MLDLHNCQVIFDVFKIIPVRLLLICSNKNRFTLLYIYSRHSLIHTNDGVDEDDELEECQGFSVKRNVVWMRVQILCKSAC